MTIRVIGVQFVGDDSTLQRALNRSEADIQKFKKTSEQAGASVEAASKRQVKANEDNARSQKKVGDAAIIAARQAEDASQKQVAAAERAAYRDHRARVTAEKAVQREQAKTAREAAALREKRLDASERVGTGLLVAGGITGAGIALAVREFARFDQAMSRAAAGTDATRGELVKLREAAIRAGADSQYSATEAADAITALGKAGVSTRDILAGGLAGSLNLAAAGQLEVGRAAEIAATAMTQFQLKGEDIGRVSDLLAAGAGKAQGDVTDLANAMKYVGPIAAGMGISIEETTGTLALFASQGIISEQAGTSLRGLLSSLTSPSKQAAAEMKNLGLNMYDARGQFIGLQGVAGQLQEALGGMSEAQRDAALGVLFGNEQLTAARVLYQGGADAVAEWTSNVTDSGYAARQAARLTDNLYGDLERLQGSLSSVFLQQGSGTNDALRGLVQGIEDVVDAYASLPAPVQQAAVTLTLVATATALVGGALLVVIPRVARARVALEELGVSGAKASRGMALAAKSAALLGAITIVPDIAGGFDKAIGKTSDDVSGLAKSMQELARTGKLSGEAAKQWGKDFEGAGGILNKVSGGFFLDSKNIREEAERLNSTSFFDRDIGGDSSAAKNFKSMGEALAQLVQSGNAEDAGKAFDILAEKTGYTGSETGKLLKLMPAYQDALDAAGQSAEGTAAGVGSVATNLDQMGTAAQAAATALNEAMAAAEESTRKAFEGGTDVLGSFDPEKKGKAAGKELEQQYKDTIKQTEQFTRDITTAFNDGLDPRYVQELLQQGPEQAGPVLRAIVSDHSGRLIEMVNSSEDTLAKLGELAVEQARLTARAVESGTDEMTSKLGVAMRVAQAKASQGARASTRSIARALRIPEDEVRNIARQFGITLTDEVQAAVKGRTINVKARARVRVEYQDTYDSEVRRDAATAARGAGRASGGPIYGPGTATSDSVPIMASHGEYMQQAAAVAHYGMDVMHALNARRIPKETLQRQVYGYATGGAIGFPPRTAGGSRGGSRPVVVRVPVQENHHRPVHVNGPISVQSDTPQAFVDWASTTAAYT